MGAIKNTKVYLDGFDLSGDLNASALDYGAEMLDATTFGNEARINTAGLYTARMNHEGHWRAGGTGPDDSIYARLGTANAVVTLAPETGAVAEIAYTFRAVHSEYSQGGQVGAITPFSVTAEGDDGVPPVRGKILKAAGSVTATGTGTAVGVGAATSGQTVYAALHVISASGTSPTLDVVVQSDVDNTFTTPATVATFAQKTAIGSDWQTAAGPNTDTYFRVSYTVGGTSPSFSFIVVVGII